MTAIGYKAHEKNGILFFAKLEQTYPDRWSFIDIHPLVEEERRPNFFRNPREKNHTTLGMDIPRANAGARNHHLWQVPSICCAE